MTSILDTLEAVPGQVYNWISSWFKGGPKGKGIARATKLRGMVESINEGILAPRRRSTCPWSNHSIKGATFTDFCTDIGLRVFQDWFYHIKYLRFRRLCYLWYNKGILIAECCLLLLISFFWPGCMVEIPVLEPSAFCLYLASSPRS